MSFKNEDFRTLRIATYGDGEWRLLDQQWIDYALPSISALLKHFSPYALLPGATNPACLCDVGAVETCCERNDGVSRHLPVRASDQVRRIRTGPHA